MKTKSITQIKIIQINKLFYKLNLIKKNQNYILLKVENWKIVFKESLCIHSIVQI